MTTFPLPSSASWPERWRNVPLWSIFHRTKDVGHPDEEMLSVYREFGVVRKEGRTDNANQTAENRDIYQLVYPEWLIVNRMKAWQGSVGVSPYRGIVSGHYLCFRNDHSEDSAYLNWLFRSRVYAAEFARMSRGVRPGQIEIDNDVLRGLRVALPAVEDQAKIADFLDRETQVIDRTAELQSKVRRLLERRFQAQRDLQVEGVSRECGTLPLRRFLHSIQQGVSPQCDNVEARAGEWGVLKVSAVKGGRFLPCENKRLPSDVSADVRFKIRAGDLLITRANTPNLVGSAAVVEQFSGDLLLCDKIFRLRTSADLDPHFLVEVAMSSRIRAMCAEVAHGASQSMANLKIEEIRRWPVPAADRDVQRTVVDELRDARDHLNSLVATIDRQLALLAERRQALITAAVTGQIDVSTARSVDV